MSFAKQFSFKSSRRLLAYGLGLTAFGGLSVAYHLSREASRTDDAIHRQSHHLTNLKPYELKGQEAVQYPWYSPIYMKAEWTPR